MASELEILQRTLNRERKARKAAEQTLEKKSFELFQTNEQLRKVNANLEELVSERTAELKESESRFRLIVETASDIIYRTDSRGHFTYANPTALQKMGYSIEELREMHFTELVADNYRQELQEFYMNQYHKKLSETYKEFPAVTKNGDTLWIGQNVIYLYDGEGEIKQVSAVARDITDSKISQTRLINLIENIQSGVLLEDENRKIALVNQRFCNKFGIEAPPEALVGADCSNSAEESKSLFEDEEGFVERINQILEEKELVRGDELKLKDGRVFERDYIPIFIDNHYSGHLWNYRDVTKERNYLKDIQRSEEKYRGIIANMNLGLLEVDAEEKIVFANHSFSEMSGFEMDELIGKNASKLFVRGDNMELMKRKNNLRVEGVSDAYEIATKNKRGEAKWWLISGAPRFDDKGKQIGSVGIHLDITKQKELEEELVKAKYEAEESAAAKEVFLANMSHEIRTPMNGIVGMVRQLSKTQLDEQQVFYLDTIRSAADNLLVVLNDILDLSKIEAGKLSVERVPFPFMKTMKQACQVMMPKAEEKGLEMQSGMDERIAEMLCGDPYRLNQVMLNLIGNAIKFTDKGRVDMYASLVEDRGGEQVVSISVKDTGIGMEESYLEKIFEKFSQEDRTISRQFGGTGLGMNISKQLVELMGGKIAVKSRKGSGTEVIVTIPFRIPKEEVMNTREKFSSSNKEILQGKKVLVAEDNELNRLVIEATLQPYGVIITTANNGREAINALKASTFDIVLMDIQMPNVNGVEATEFIRKEMKLDVPIVALTANVLKGDSDRYRLIGMNDFVPKPFEEDQIIDVMIQQLEGRSSKTNQNQSESADEESEAKLYSLEKLVQISRGNEEFVNRMVSVFVKQSHEAVEEIRQAIESNDFDRISKVSHRMKPSIDNMEITSLKSKIRTLEKLAMESIDKDEIHSLAEQVIGRLAWVAERIEAEQNNSN